MIYLHYEVLNNENDISPESKDAIAVWNCLNHLNAILDVLSHLELDYSFVNRDEIVNRLENLSSTLQGLSSLGTMICGEAMEHIDNISDHLKLSSKDDEQRAV